MKRFAMILTLGGAALAPGLLAAMEGRVTTRDGQSFLGQVRLQSNTVLIASLANAQLYQVALSNLSSLRLISGPVGSSEPTARANELAGGAGWRGTDVGPVRLHGNSTIQDGRVRLRASTLPHAGGLDSWHLAFATLEGDGEIVGRLLRLAGNHRTALAGLMMRGSLRPDAPALVIGQSSAGGLTAWRLASGEAMRRNPHRLVHDWMRLKRDGDWLSAYSSPDGIRWRLVDKVRLSLAREILVGCALEAPSSDVHPHAVAWFDQVRVGKGLRLRGFVPKVTLKSGSLLVEDLAFTRDGQLHFKGIMPLPEVPLRHAARLDFQWLPSQWSTKVEGGRRGALLASGEFFEGDLKSLRGGTCTMSTVLFGLRRFDAHHDIVSIVLGERKERPARGEIRTWSGSILRGRIESFGEEGLVLIEPLLGRITIPFFALKAVSLPRG